MPLDVTSNVICGTSGLLTAERIQKVGATDANDLASKLIRAKQLTAYQAEQICAGNTTGLVLGNYVILDKIGAGGMGAVFKARHKRMDRVVALKVLPFAALESENAVERFHREVKAAARLEHHNIVTAHDADEFDGQHFLVMQYADGEDLSSLVKSKGRMPIGKAVDCIIQAAKGLDYAHGEGVIHRDIKPANLLLNKKGVVKILDMGLARLDKANEEVFAPTQAELTAEGAVMGTIDYLSPEQALDTHNADARSDIYSLGCTLHYLLIGAPIYGGTTLVAKLLAHRQTDIPSLREERDDVPEELETIFARMVAKEPDERYDTMTALLEELEAVAGQYEETWEQAYADEATAVATESVVDIQSKETSSSDVADTMVAQPKVEPALSPSPAKQTEGGGNSRRYFVGGVAVLMLGLLAYWLFGIIFKVETPDGIIQIETNVTDVEIFVDGEKVVHITDPKDKTKIRVEIPKGAETLRVSKDGFEADVKEFKLNTVDGPIEVSFVPVKKPTVGGDVEREVAEWVLGIGGTVRVYVGSEDEFEVIKTVEQLPKRAFRVGGVGLAYNKQVTDDDVKRLAKLSSVAMLHFREAQITEKGLAHLAGIKTVTTLFFPRSCEDGLKYFQDCSLIKFEGNRFTDKGLELLGQQKDLENLSIAFCEFTDDGLAHLAVLNKLRGLGLIAAKITDAGLQQLSGLENLQSLVLSENSINGTGFENVRGMKSLSQRFPVRGLL